MKERTTVLTDADWNRLLRLLTDLAWFVGKNTLIIDRRQEREDEDAEDA